MALRVALFTDSLHEANGVATLSRQFAEYARTEELPFCCVHGGRTTQATQQGSVLTLELKRSLASFPMDTDLYCDLLLSRYRNRMLEQMRSFEPDLIHITGPGDIGVLGFWVSHLLKIPMAASWHTNLHEYAGRRLHNFFSFLPGGLRQSIANAAEHQSLRALTGFYRQAHFILAPNATTVEMLHDRTGRPCYLMAHGVDVERFSPQRRTRTDGRFCVGYVGRLTPEKNVRSFAALERSLLDAGQRGFRFLLVGDGSEREWLAKNLQSGELPGNLRGDALSAAFADMDAFVFPSQTDTFGLVLLEAMASGVPVVTYEQTGLRAGVQDGVTGLLGNNFTQSVLRLMQDRDGCRRMGCEAHHFASTQGWCQMFRKLFRVYERALEGKEVRCRMTARA